MNRTPWSGSLSSDRLKPSRSPSKQSLKGGGQGKGKGKENEAPKSEKVKGLESLISALSGDGSDKGNTGKGKGREGGVCFCQAREHSLSPYTPICTSCGLILCALNHNIILSSPSTIPCPHCSSPLVTPPSRDALIARLVAELDDVKEKERLDEERMREEAMAREGAFPMLAGSASSSTGSLVGGGTGGGGGGGARKPQLQQTLQSHKVLSLNSKTKKAMVTTYTRTPIASPALSTTTSRAASPAPTTPAAPVPVPIPPPPRSNPSDFERSNRNDPAKDDDPWYTPPRGPTMGIKYVPVPAPTDWKVDGHANGEGSGRRRRRRGGKGKEVEGNVGAGGGAGGSGGADESAKTEPMGGKDGL